MIRCPSAPRRTAGGDCAGTPAGPAGWDRSAGCPPSSRRCLCHRRYFRREIALLLLDALAHHEVAVARELRLFRVEHLLHGELVVLHERLGGKRDLAEELFDAA